MDTKLSTTNTATCANTDTPGISSTSTNTAAAAKPSHSMNAPGASASAANSSNATAAQVTVSQFHCIGQPPVRGSGGTARVGCRSSASLASSAIPASEPITPADSIGIITNFWFGASANALNASMYFCATK